ncbi:hypothetical protein NITHO_1470011 [Nitrolancea hollandica Lb]|uniref:Uncharacterized protein n=1 Tax=Nitrolancea hollandica Lb TaxID=1129897 RepID=I4EDE6_9BACT|nr:hypothetical protein NITHO_1470011 [Nitrolancea hollandica Lb]
MAGQCCTENFDNSVSCSPFPGPSEGPEARWEVACPRAWRVIDYEPASHFWGPDFFGQGDEEKE